MSEKEGDEKRYKCKVVVIDLKGSSKSGLGRSKGNVYMCFKKHVLE